jgi:hypothetical protein
MKRNRNVQAGHVEGQIIILDVNRRFFGLPLRLDPDAFPAHTPRVTLYSANSPAYSQITEYLNNFAGA